MSPPFTVEGTGLRGIKLFASTHTLSEQWCSFVNSFFPHSPQWPYLSCRYSSLEFILCELRWCDTLWKVRVFLSLDAHPEDDTFAVLSTMRWGPFFTPSFWARPDATAWIWNIPQRPMCLCSLFVPWQWDKWPFHCHGLLPSCATTCLKDKGQQIMGRNLQTISQNKPFHF